MLIRMALAVRDKSLQRHLADKLTSSDVRVESFADLRFAWQNVIRSGCDVIVISEDLILHPADNGIAILNELPENPTTVVIHGSDSAEENAQLAAAGADVLGHSHRRMELRLDHVRQDLQRGVERLGKPDPPA